MALRVVPPNRRYAVRIRVSDPAAYLKYRFAPVAEVVNRLTNRLWFFRSRTVAVVDRAGRRVFTVTHVRYSDAGPRTQGTRWYIQPALAGCAENIPGFEIEVADTATSACPA